MKLMYDLIVGYPCKFGVRRKHCALELATVEY